MPNSTRQSIMAAILCAISVLIPVNAADSVHKQRNEDGTVTFSDAPLNKDGQRIAYAGNYGRPQATASCRGQTSLDAEFQRASVISGLDIELLTAVARIESCFDPKAQSTAGAQGVMQLMPATAAELGVFNSFDPAANIEGGARYLSKMLAIHKGDIKLALASYNAGPGAVAKHGGIPPYPETIAYVKKVTKQLAQNQANAERSSTL